MRKRDSEAPGTGRSMYFVGRCADQILKDDNQLLRVYIYASDMEDRIKRIKKNKHISQREALDRIAYKDRQRRDYYNFYTGHEWGKWKTMISA